MCVCVCLFVCVRVLVYRQDVFHCNNKDVVANQTIPVNQDDSDWLQQQVSAHQQEVEAGDQVAHAEDTDPAK